MPRHHGVVTDLSDLMSRHLAAPFPDEVENGRDYGLVDTVMIGADIYGWALAASRQSLDADGRRLLSEARAELASSLSEVPAPARPYYGSPATCDRRYPASSGGGSPGVDGARGSAGECSRPTAMDT